MDACDVSITQHGPVQFADTPPLSPLPSHSLTVGVWGGAPALRWQQHQRTPSDRCRSHAGRNSGHRDSIPQAEDLSAPHKRAGAQTPHRINARPDVSHSMWCNRQPSSARPIPSNHFKAILHGHNVSRAVSDRDRDRLRLAAASYCELKERHLVIMKWCLVTY